MIRRELIKKTTLATIGLTLSGTSFALEKKVQTAGDLNRFLRSLHEVKEPSVDRIIIGDPKTKILKAGTCWMPFMHTLKEAKSKGINTLIVHEPTFYTHWDLDGVDQFLKGMPELARKEYQESINQKKRWIEDNKMVIIRCHDVLDIVKGFGIPYALGQTLGFSNDDIIRSKDYFNVYAIKKDSAINVAKKISKALKPLGQPGVKFYGDKNRIVSTIGVGTGYNCDPKNSKDLYPDLSIAIDDTMRAWTQPHLASDTGNPLLVINHGTSEDTGLKLLSEFLNSSISNLKFLHLEQGCVYEWV